jgi:hypothetical protein
MVYCTNTGSTLGSVNNQLILGADRNSTACGTTKQNAVLENKMLNDNTMYLRQGQLTQRHSGQLLLLLYLYLLLLVLVLPLQHRLAAQRVLLLVVVCVNSAKCVTYHVYVSQ